MIRYIPDTEAASRMRPVADGGFFRARDVDRLIVGVLAHLDDAAASGGRDVTSLLACRDLIQEQFPDGG